MALLAIVACGSDDPDEPSKSGIDTRVVGTWSNVENDDDETTTETLSLMSDGTFIDNIVIVLRDADDIEMSGYRKAELKLSGVFTTKDGVMTMVVSNCIVRYDEGSWTEQEYQDGAIAQKYKVAGNKLTFTDEDGDQSVYIKK